MPTNILVVGGAGFIGSHMIGCLQQAGYLPVVLDNLSTGHADAVLHAELIVGDVADNLLLNELFKTHPFQAVIHFASCIQVGESVLAPEKYYLNNVAATLQLLKVMREHKVKNFVFSSSAAVYGEPQYTPIDENHPVAPINPYGHSKRMIEQVLMDYANAYDFHFAALRYFNAAGSGPDGRLQERHEPETHLIPLVLDVAAGKRPSMTVFGHDYPTPDGSCIRDYVHVTDLCTAHLQALEALFSGENKLIYNLGTGQGFSVYEVIAAAREMTGHPIPIIEADRRGGDPAILVANPSLAMKKLGWQPKYSDLRTILNHAWQARNGC